MSTPNTDTSTQTAPTPIPPAPQNLDNIKVGDLVTIKGTFGVICRVVTKVKADRIIVQWARSRRGKGFLKKTKRGIGGDGGSNFRLLGPSTPEEIAAHEAKLLRKKAEVLDTESDGTEAPESAPAIPPEITAPAPEPSKPDKTTPVPLLAFHPALRNLIQPLTEPEYELLKSSILAHGCLDPLKVWKIEAGDRVLLDDDHILLDGHNRYRICMENGIPFTTVNVSLDSLEHAKLWILENQAGRRNLTDDQRAVVWNEIREQRSKIERAQQLANARSIKAGSGSVSAEMTDTEKAKKDTRAAVAKESGIPESNLKKAQKLKKQDPEQYKKVRAGATTLSKASKSTKKKKKTAKSPPVTKQAQPATVTVKHETPAPEPQTAVTTEPEAPGSDDFFADFEGRERPERRAEFKVTLSVASTQLKTVEKAAKSAFGDMLFNVTKVVTPKTRADRMVELSEQISDARESAEEFRDELNDAKDNLPENFQESAGEEIDGFVDALETTISALEEAESGLGI